MQTRTRTHDPNDGPSVSCRNILIGGVAMVAGSAMPALTAGPGAAGTSTPPSSVPGNTHSLGDTSKEQLNADLLAFLKA